MASALRSVALFSLATALFVGLGMPACSQQGEGEHCDKAKFGNNDCDAGLSCVSRNDLIDSSSDRCCSTSSNDTRCTRRSESSGTGGKGGSTSVTDGGTPAGGDAGNEGGSAPGDMSTGGSTSETPNAGSSSGGTPNMTDGGAPAAGASQLPASGQGGAD